VELGSLLAVHLDADHNASDSSVIPMSAML
jgi:hypothetical protein